LLKEGATKVDIGQKPFRVWFAEKELTCEALIIATGATAKTLGLPREKELMGFGLSTCATCDGAFFKDKEIVVIGGGDTAAEEAQFLTKFGTRVRVIVRRDRLRASKIMADRVMAHPKIEVIFNENHRSKGITGGVLQHTETGEKREIQTDAIFYGIGHRPNTELFTAFLKTDPNGYLITKPDSTKTEVPGVFACGDVQDHVFRQAVTAAGSGCMAAMEAERYLAGH
jgi:thioredoxin reductase (NADPH)